MLAAASRPLDAEDRAGLRRRDRDHRLNALPIAGPRLSERCRGVLLAAGSVPRGGRGKVEAAIRAREGNVTRAATDRGVSQMTLHRWVRRLGITLPERDG